MKDIHTLRQDIDTISREIRDGLLKRRRLVEKILRLKKEKNLSIHDPAREQELLEILIEGQTKDDQEYIKTIFQAIFTEMRRIPEK